MVTTALRYAPEDPFSLLESCQRTLEWILYNHRHQPINRCWIDHPYGEEEIIHAQCIPYGMEGRSPLHAVWGRCLPEAA